MKDKIVNAIRSRSRESWQALAFDRWTSIRIWIQEHGEKAALIALVGGIFFVLAFKVVVLCAILALLASYVIYFVALPESAGGKADFLPSESDKSPGPPL